MDIDEAFFLRNRTSEYIAKMARRIALCARPTHDCVASLVGQIQARATTRGRFYRDGDSKSGMSVGCSHQSLQIETMHAKVAHLRHSRSCDSRLSTPPRVTISRRSGTDDPSEAPSEGWSICVAHENRS